MVRDDIVVRTAAPAGHRLGDARSARAAGRPRKPAAVPSGAAERASRPEPITREFGDKTDETISSGCLRNNSGLRRRCGQARGSGERGPLGERGRGVHLRSALGQSHPDGWLRPSQVYEPLVDFNSSYEIQPCARRCVETDLTDDLAIRLAPWRPFPRRYAVHERGRCLQPEPRALGNLGLPRTMYRRSRPSRPSMITQYGSRPAAPDPILPDQLNVIWHDVEALGRAA